MATSDAVLQVLSGAGPRSFSSDLCFNNLDLAFRSKHIKYVKKRASRHMKMLECSSVQQNCIGKHWFKRSGDGDLSVNATIKRMQLLRCKCQKAERVSGVTTEGGNGTWFVDSAKTLNLNGAVNTPGVLELGDTQQLMREKEVLTSNGSANKEEESLATNGAVGTGRDASRKVSVDPTEEEAWELLRDSVVHYCGSPIGTIAANDPTSSSVLNYDQVFIRDFIPSGIAFLLKGEYDIVRNFLLHTLQLQSWEKTMDCHSPGQGLMPASFKVRTFPLDGDDSATEEVLDPDFGEAAIGRVAPVDSGLWWIILLRAYGKCSGDLSVQERIDVQTGIKMILRLCLADGFDMFPTLLVTDGSCMIDRRMGIHGHPLEIQNYSAWAFQFQIFVKGKELWGHIAGTVPAPDSEQEKEKYVKWEVKDAQIMSWILGSMEHSMLLNLKPYKSSREMWDYLKKVYNQSNTARRFQLELELGQLSQGSMSIQEFYSSFVNLWAEYTDIVYASVPPEGLIVIQRKP